MAYRYPSGDTNQQQQQQQQYPPQQNQFGYHQQQQPQQNQYNNPSSSYPNQQYQQPQTGYPAQPTYGAPSYPPQQPTSYGAPPQTSYSTPAPYSSQPSFPAPITTPPAAVSTQPTYSSFPTAQTPAPLQPQQQAFPSHQPAFPAPIQPSYNAPTTSSYGAPPQQTSPYPSANQPPIASYGSAHRPIETNDYPPQMQEDGPLQPYKYGQAPAQTPGGIADSFGSMSLNAQPPTQPIGGYGNYPTSNQSIAPPQMPGQPQQAWNQQPGMNAPMQAPHGVNMQNPSISAHTGPIIPPWAKLPHSKYLSLTCSAMPNSGATRARSNLSVGAVLRPLADPPSSTIPQPLPVINPQQHGVIRCRDCRAYINPFVTFMNGGAQWRCNLCLLPNDVPSTYFSSLDANGRRHDIDERPELTQGSIEIIAPVDYMVRQPMPPVYFFVIDVSLQSVQSGMLKIASQTILSVLDKLPGDKRTQIGFITFDSTVHFYTLKPGDNSTPSVFVLSDLEDIFLPVPDHLLVNLDESRPQVEQFLTSLPNLYQSTRDVESCLGPALDAAVRVMSKIGGKLAVMLSGLPSLGAGRLQNRENSRVLGTEKENTLLQPATDFYRKEAIKYTKYQICCDLYLFPEQYCDISSISELSKLTGGQVYYYPSFHSDIHGKKFTKELQRNLTRTQGWESVVRVRGSKGVKITDFHGHFYMRGTDLLAVPGVDSDKAFAFEIRNDEAMITTPTISLQAALLYTTSSGERRIRVHTTCIPVTSIMGELFDRVNVNAMTNLIAKQAIDLVLKENFERAREFIRNKCVSIIRTHRAALAKQQATVSNELNVLPLMSLGLLKNAAFKEGVDVRTDLRSYILTAMYTMGIVEMETFVRPRMLPIHDLKDNEGLLKEAAGGTIPGSVGQVELPAESGLTAEVLKTDTAYLIDNGMEFLMRLGRGVSPTFLQSVFGVSSIDAVDTKSLSLLTPLNDDFLSPCRRLHNILSYLREVSPHYQQLYVVKEGEAQEMRFLNMLIEDRNMSAMSLAEFDQFIHRANAY